MPKTMAGMFIQPTPPVHSIVCLQKFQHALIYMCVCNIYTYILCIYDIYIHTYTYIHTYIYIYTYVIVILSPPEV